MHTKRYISLADSTKKALLLMIGDEVWRPRAILLAYAATLTTFFLSRSHQLFFCLKKSCRHLVCERVTTKTLTNTTTSMPDKLQDLVFAGNQREVSPVLSVCRAAASVQPWNELTIAVGKPQKCVLPQTIEPSPALLMTQILHRGPGHLSGASRSGLCR